MRQQADIPTRFAATKAIEGDPLILEKLKLDTNETEMLEHIVQQMEIRASGLTEALRSQICVLTLLSVCVNRQL